MTIANTLIQMEGKIFANTSEIDTKESLKLFFLSFFFATSASERCRLTVHEPEALAPRIFQQVLSRMGPWRPHSCTQSQMTNCQLDLSSMSAFFTRIRMFVGTMKRKVLDPCENGIGEE